MREFFVEIFKDEGPLKITLFNIWHILYIVIILGVTIFLAIYTFKKSRDFKNKLLNIIAYIIIATYISDFFFHPLYFGGINMDKLPFHICTLMAPLIILTRFNKPLNRFKKTIVVFSIVGPLMYITYPGTAIGDVSPFVYKTVQTFFYHGAVFCFGILSVTTGDVKLEFKKIWQELVGLCLIALWAAFGNSVYSTADQSFDWFFITGRTFPFVPKPLMPITVVVCIFAMCAIIHLIFYFVYKQLQKKNAYEHLNN